jgi:hypothetical protein
MALVRVANGEAAVTSLVLALMVVVARLALTGIGQIGWAGLNRVLAAVLVPAPVRHVSDPEGSSASPRRRTFASSLDAAGTVVS